MGNGDIPQEVKLESVDRAEDHLTGARSEAFPVGDTQVAAAAGNADEGARIASNFADSTAFGGSAALQAIDNMEASGHLDKQCAELLRFAHAEPERFKKLLQGSSA